MVNELEQIFSVSDINRYAHNLLDKQLGRISVEGEISQLTLHRSGHWYFTLKDHDSQIRVAMFKRQNQRVKTPLSEGDQVILKGKLAIYAPRGDYQLIADDVEPAGIGKLLKQFEALKSELQQLGWFSEFAKQPLPAHPHCVAIVTSPQAAAFADMRTTFLRRNPSLEIILVPVAVQGTDAAKQIADAVYQINSTAADGHIKPDAIIVGRGGGSIEDLWAFNEQVVAEAIFHSKIPVVSAVGHESDITISDLVADCRAATPTAAAELLSVDSSEVKLKLASLFSQLCNAMGVVIELKRQEIMSLKTRLRHPGYTVSLQSQRLDHLDSRLQAAVAQTLYHAKQRQHELNAELMRWGPETQIPVIRDHILLKQERMRRAIESKATNLRQQLQKSSSNLDIVSPLATLARGYSITSNSAGKTITLCKQLKSGDEITTKVSDGSIESIVK